MGLGDTKDGSKGADLILPVPVGTVVFEAKGPQGKPKHPGEQLADLRHAGDKFVVAAGGNGGLGNAALANRTRRAPGFALLGEPGEERDVILELKSIADVALVGFPSAGKSSLIAAMSSAKPKIADYPFTTLVPNLGVVVAGDMRYTIADVPGLIPGASQGKGLGLEFLRHIERTEIIAHVIDCATLEPGRDPMSDYQRSNTSSPNTPASSNCRSARFRSPNVRASSSSTRWMCRKPRNSPNSSSRIRKARPQGLHHLHRLPRGPEGTQLGAGRPRDQHARGSRQTRAGRGRGPRGHQAARGAAQSPSP